MSIAPTRPAVALVSDSVYPYHSGGKELRYHEIGQRIGGEVDLTIYTMRWWDGPVEHRDGAILYRALCDHQELYVDGGRRSIRQAIVFGLASARLLFRRFDVVEADHIPYAQLFVLKLVTLLRRRRLVVTWHEVWDAAYWRAYLGRLGIVAAAAGRLAMLLPDEIIAASPESADRLRGLVRRGTTVTVAPNGIDVGRVRAVAPAASGTDLVFVGRLIEHKGVDLLIDAVADLRDAGEPLTALVIGRGPHLPALRAHAAARGVEHLVTFRDDVETADEVYAAMKAARAFVFPSVREGFGIAVLEALACGLPVVTTSHPDNLSQHLAQGSGRGHLCAPDAAGVATAIRAALRDEGTTPEAWLATYDWDVVARSVLEAYRR